MPCLSRTLHSIRDISTQYTSNPKEKIKDKEDMIQKTKTHLIKSLKIIAYYSECIKLLKKGISITLDLVLSLMVNKRAIQVTQMLKNRYFDWENNSLKISALEYFANFKLLQERTTLYHFYFVLSLKTKVDSLSKQKKKYLDSLGGRNQKET